MSNLFSELKRRNVFRAGVTYTVVAWVIAQAFDLAVDNFGAPDWVMKMILAILVAGLPITLIMAWAFELTPDGVKKTDEVPATESITPRTGKTLNRVTTSALILVLAFVAWDKLGSDSDTHNVISTEKSVAVLPFADLSELQDQEWFADGLTEEILNSLARLPELQVTARTSSFAFKGQNTDISEIAKTLGVANVVEGSVRRIGNRLRVTAQLIRARDGIHLWSNTYDSTTENLFDVQHDVAENIAATLDVILDDEKRDRMFSFGTRNVAAFEALMKGREKFGLAHSRQDSQTVSLAEANVLLELAMELDPAFGLPAILHSDRYAHILLEGQARIVGGDDNVDAETAHRLLMKDFDFAVQNAANPMAQLMAEFNREFFATDWNRMPALVEQIRIAIAGDAALPTDTIWSPEILSLVGETDLLKAIVEHKIAVDPLNISAWLDLAEVYVQQRNYPAAYAGIDDIRHRFGVSNRLRELEVRIALAREEHQLAIELMGVGFDMSSDYFTFQPIFSALQGDYEKALSLANKLKESSPAYSMSYLYTLMGDEDAARAEISRIDALPAGPTLLALELIQYPGLFGFSIDDAPQLKARFEEAGIDPARFESQP